MKKIFFYIVLLTISFSCGTARKAGKNDQANNYKHDVTAIHPQFAVFHVNDTITELHYKISSKELLYTRPDGINFSCNILISFRLTSSYDSKEIVDSSSVRLVDMNNEAADKYLVGSMNVKARSPRSYFLRINITDLNRNTTVSSVIPVEKESDLNRQNFMVKSKATDLPLFRNYFKPGEALEISYKSRIGVNLFVRYYNRDFPLAAPPFSMTEPKPFQYKPDSTYVLQLSPSGSVDFTATKKGFYHLQLDTTKRDGVTLFNFSETFPEIKKAEDMVFPLRFITSREEYEELSTSKNKKAAVEEFWVSNTGSRDRAKEVIRKYYNRVQDANLYFTSYLEGWKTDRGMMYLIYGSPNIIYRTANSETWIYGEENNLNSMHYSFSRVNNPFTDNDFTLERATVYKQSWYVAVDIWRQGRTYLQD